MSGQVGKNLKHWQIAFKNGKATQVVHELFFQNIDVTDKWGEIINLNIERSNFLPSGKGRDKESLRQITHPHFFFHQQQMLERLSLVIIEKRKKFKLEINQSG